MQTDRVAPTIEPEEIERELRRAVVCVRSRPARECGPSGRGSVARRYLCGALESLYRTLVSASLPRPDVIPGCIVSAEAMRVAAWLRQVAIASGPPATFGAISHREDAGTTA